MALAHDGLRFALTSAPALIGSAKGDGVRRGLVAGYYSAVLSGLEVHHHGEEELLFPLLIERFPDERKKVDLGAQQHHEVVSFLASAEIAVTDWAKQGDSESTNAVLSLAALEQCLSVHLDHEESAIVPLEARLTEDERIAYMGRLVKHHMARLHPNPAEWFLMFSHGKALLWEAVGEASFRDMIAKAQQRN